MWFKSKAEPLPEVDDALFDQKIKLWQARLSRREFALKTFTICLLIITAGLAVIQYLSQRAQLIEQNKTAQDQRVKDFNLTIYRARLDIYLEATDTLSKFVYASNLREAEKAEQRFWELYDGKFSVLEDEGARDEMILAGDFLLEWEKCKTIPVPDLLQDLAYDFTQTCRRSLKMSFPSGFSNESNPLTSGEPKHGPHLTRAMLECVCQW